MCYCFWLCSYSTSGTHLHTWFIFRAALCVCGFNKHFGSIRISSAHIWCLLVSVMLLFSWFKCTNCANFDRLSSPNKSSTPPRSSSLLPFDPLMKHLKQRHGLGSERRPSRAACNQKVKVLNCGASNMRSSSVSHWVSLPCPPFSSGAAEQKQQ